MVHCKGTFLMQTIFEFFKKIKLLFVYNFKLKILTFVKLNF